MASTTQATAKALISSPTIGAKALARMICMSRGIERKTSKSAPTAALGQPGADARSTPKTVPRTVPPSTDQNVSINVTPAPRSMKRMSCQETVALNIGRSVAKQPPRREPRREHQDFGDQVVENSRHGEIFERAISQHVEALRHAGQISIEADSEAESGHEDGKDHLVGDRIVDDAKQLRQHDEPKSLGRGHAKRSGGPGLRRRNGAQSAAKRLREIARIVERNAGSQRGVAIEVQTKRAEPEISEIDLEEAGRITPKLDPG